MRHPAFLIAAGLAATAAPAAAETVTDEQVWLNATVIGTVPGSRLAYFLEAQPRFVDGAGRLGQLILRPAIGWKASDRVTAYAGYAHVVLPVERARDRNEDRLFLQLSWTLPKSGAGTLSSRTRLEHRRLSTGSDTGWRVREMIRYVHPLGRPQRTRALVSAEAFVALNDTDWGARAGFDQLRGFAGVEIPLAGRTTIEAGYLNQLINDPGGRRRMNHVASLSLFVRP
ncbi:DUF2490 domain-containing protein [Sphingomonas profundi]|uniref:DUF2490 domain-containing protein n=1 Tax=Alterirhizorhabdus profundi TaxID=2681549 RepID=UPI0012E82DA3|nr:DUF2490 domain-containing protein [Sphingomonas profundi]